MIDSIFIAMSGLSGHQRGLKVISNNVANMNTPGFKSASLTFADVMGGAGVDVSGNSIGNALAGSGAMLDLRSGDLSQTGRDLDLALQGDGFFVLQDETGQSLFTRAGGFEFNADSVLVVRSTGLKVMGRDGAGKLVPVDLKGLKLNAPKVTSEILFTGNLSSTDTDHTIDSLVVIDKLGGAHTLKVELKNNTATPGSWLITVFEGTKQVGSGEIKFENGKPVVGAAKPSIALALVDGDPSPVEFVFGDDVTGFSSGTTSTLAMKSQNGHALGQISSLKFDSNGQLKITYSNGQTADGLRLALAQVSDDTGMVSSGDSVYRYEGSTPPAIGEAGDTLKVVGQSLELSNVDLTEEFSALILMQRGYQASSQVLSTANDMLQELFDMKGRR
jgi:flagellar hook protein FlgE